MCIMEVASKDLLSKLCFYVYFFPQYWNFSSCGLLFVLDILLISFFFFFLKIGSLLGVNNYVSFLKLVCFFKISFC